MKCCPIHNALTHLGKKWALEIIRDLFKESKRFNQLLVSNQGISTKMLSARLKDLQDEGFVQKTIVSTNPVQIEYALTEKGRGLNKILYELAAFSLTRSALVS